MREAVTHDCAFFETPDVDFSPGEPGWNAIWAHRMTDPPRSRFEVTFELKQVTGDLLLTAAHLTASTVENGVQIGYAPISLVVNDDDGDPFNGTHLALHMGPDGNSPADGFDVGYNHDDRHGLETDTFLLPAQHLRAGTNTVTWAFGAEARSSYRLQALRIYAPSRGRLQFTSEAYRVDEAGRMAVLRVLRQDSWEGEVSARFQVRAITAAPGSDYEDVSGTVTFRHQEQSQTIVIPIQADSESEGPETFEVCLSDPGPGCVLGHPATTVVTVMDEQTRASALHVDRDSPVDGNGLDWKTAFHDLQDALREARRACVAHREIWVAGGTYTPDGGSLDPGASFQLVDGVALYGGFQGNETRRSQRDPLLHPTILSGDLNGDDGPGFTNTSDNAHHVVRAADVGATSILDGFVVQGGYGTTLYGEYTSTGGGLFLRHASPVIRNCTIRWNRAMDGAGAFCHGLSFPAFEACRFEGNLVDVPITGGAGLSNRTSSPLLLNCVFLGNRCLGTGGALCNWDSSPTVLQCTFSWNTAMEYTGRGGSVFVFGAAFDTRPVLRNCILTSNFANEGNQFGFMGTASLFIEHSILEDIGSLSWIEMYRQAGLVKGPGVEDRDVQLTPDGRLISRVDALGGVACDPAATDIDGEVRSPVRLRWARTCFSTRIGMACLMPGRRGGLETPSQGIPMRTPTETGSPTWTNSSFTAAIPGAGLCSWMVREAMTRTTAPRTGPSGRSGPAWMQPSPGTPYSWPRGPTKARATRGSSSRAARWCSGVQASPPRPRSWTATMRGSPFDSPMERLRHRPLPTCRSCMAGRRWEGSCSAMQRVPCSRTAGSSTASVPCAPRP